MELVRHCGRVLLVLLVCATQPAVANEVLFYQPLNVDAALDESQWHDIMAAARREGLKTLIVQWTRHDESDFGGAGGWLLSRLRQVEASGVDIVLGLDYHSEYYQVMNAGQDPGQEAALGRWIAASIGQQRWLQRHAGLNPVGWYLAYELDDMIYADEALRNSLNNQLSWLAERLSAPLHVSAFSAGVLAPAVYAQWLAALPVDQVWWQDGLGTGALPPDVLQSYRDSLPCRIGIVAEAFVQVSDEDNAFSAVPGSPRLEPACHPLAVFSLRYRPFAAVMR